MTPKPRILLVDADPIQSMVLRKAHKQLGNCFEFEHIEDPQAVAERIGAFGPDIVLVDLSMQACSGAEVVRTLREADGGASLRIYGFFGSTSQDDSPDDREAVLEAGADDYRTKPDTLDEMLLFLRGLPGIEPA